MSELLLNPWITGIGGGIFSGLIVFVLTRWLFSDQSKKELSQKVAAANLEIIHAIRAGIPEGLTPTVSTMDSLRAATARRSNLSHEFLLTNSELIDELIKEVMDNSFISAATKEGYCNSLHQVELLDHEAMTDEERNSLAEERRRAKSDATSNGPWLATSISMGVMSGAMVAIFSALYSNGVTLGQRSIELLNVNAEFLFATGATLLALVASLMGLIVLRKTNKFSEDARMKAIRARLTLEHSLSAVEISGVDDPATQGRVAKS